MAAAQSPAPASNATGFNAFGSSQAPAVAPTPEALARRQALAMALMRAGSDSSPIRSPWQGVARVSDAISGAIQSHWADEDAAKAMQASANRWIGAANSAMNSYGGAGGAGPQAAATPGTGAANTGDIGTNLPPDGLAKQAFDFFVNKGYTPAAAAGLVGNFQQESGFSPGNIAAVSGGGDGGVSKHLAQWNGDRLTGLNNYAASVGKSPSDFNTQLGYVDWELNNTEKKTGDALRGVTDPGQAAYIAAGYERPQGWREGGSAGLINGWNNRLSYAQNAFNQWGNGGQVAANAPAAPPPVADAANVPLPPQDPRGVQVASADPSFVPQMPPGGSAGPQAAVGSPAGAPTPPASMTGANAAPEMAQMGLKPLPIANGAPMPPNAGGPAPTVNPTTGLVPDAALKQGNFQPGSLMPAQAKAFADAGYNVPNSAINWNGQDAISPAATPSTPAPTSGAPGVTNAMLAGGPQPAPAPNLSPGAQKVADAMSPQPVPPPAPVQAFQNAQGQMGTLGMSPALMQQFGAAMADPWMPEGQKQMLGNIIMSRLRPVEYGFQTLPDGTILRTNPRTGTVDPVYQAPIKRSFQELNGRLVSENPITGETSDVTPQGMPSGYRFLSPQEKQQYGFPADTPIQVGPDGKIVSNGVTVNTGTPQSNYSDEMAKGLSGPHMALENGVEAAQEAQRDVHAMQGALATIQQNKGTTGLGQQEITKIQSLINTGANALGITQPYDISDKEFLTKFNRQIAGAQAKSLGGARITNFELNNFLQSNPGLEMSPQGNERLLGIQNQTLQRGIDLGQQIRQVTADAVSRGAKVNPAQIEKMIRDYDADPTHHIVDPLTGQDITANPKLPEFQKQGAGGAQQGGAGAPPQNAIDYLKSNPSLRDAFDKKYGAGAAARALGEQQ